MTSNLCEKKEFIWDIYLIYIYAKKNNLYFGKLPEKEIKKIHMFKSNRGLIISSRKIVNW